MWPIFYEFIFIFVIISNGTVTILLFCILCITYRQIILNVNLPIFSQICLLIHFFYVVEGLDWDQNRQQNVDNCVFSKINCNTETKRKWRKIENSGMVVDMWCTRYWKTWTISLQISTYTKFKFKIKIVWPHCVLVQRYTYLFLRWSGWKGLLRLCK